MYKERKSLMETTKYHRRKGYGDTYEAASTMLLDDYLVISELAEKNSLSISNQIANIVHKYVEDNGLKIEKPENRYPETLPSEEQRSPITHKRERKGQDNGYIWLYVPADCLVSASALRL